MVRTQEIRRRRTKKGRGAGLILALGAAVALAAPPALAAADQLLSQMAGNWIGRGTFKSSPSAEPELVYCKITNTLASGGTVLQQKGRCAVASNSGRISGSITAKGAGVYAGSLESLSTKGPAQITGKASGSQIAFNATFVDTRTKKPATATIQAVVGDGKYRMVSKTVDPKTNTEFVASDIQFTKQ